MSLFDAAVDGFFYQHSQFGKQALRGGGGVVFVDGIVVDLFYVVNV
jgi:hypothetical protein